MKVLPRRTHPPKAPTLRRHEPRLATRWSQFRPCLRWDFGFTCPFCLLHESDLFGAAGGEGLGGTTVEHFVPRSVDPGRELDYTNCLYACRLCNRARSNRPIQQESARLLDPTGTAWARHFELSEDEIEPMAGDLDAAYTHETYDLNDARKVVRRQLRYQLVSDRLQLLEQLGGEIQAILRLAEQFRRDHPLRFALAIRRVRSLRSAMRRALADLARYAAVPADAPASCRCESAEGLTLPSSLEEQNVDLPEALWRLAGERAVDV